MGDYYPGTNVIDIRAGIIIVHGCNGLSADVRLMKINAS